MQRDGPGAWPIAPGNVPDAVWNVGRGPRGYHGAWGLSMPPATPAQGPGSPEIAMLNRARANLRTVVFPIEDSRQPANLNNPTPYNGKQHAPVKINNLMRSISI